MAAVYVTGLGVVGPFGAGKEALAQALAAGRPLFAPLDLFEAGPDGPRPVGAAPRALIQPHLDAGLPRTHALALVAAEEALAKAAGPPEAVILGGTTGGIPLTEELLLAGVSDPARYAWHGTGTVAELLAERSFINGPAVTLSTACASSAAALRLALELLRTGRVRRVLAGGVDGLSRLTYYGFSLLKLVDPEGARPFDRDRAGLTLSEAAALLLLESAPAPPPGALGQLLGGGLSCDAHHATAPHPEGRGAEAAIRLALADAGLEAGEIDYVNLHGTGTRDNDAAEARAVTAVFGAAPPPLSSTKGLHGHSLAAASALEAAVALLGLRDGRMPGTVGLRSPDPDLGLTPLREEVRRRNRTALSTSFGFGGNNGALVFADPTSRPRRDPTAELRTLGVRAWAWLTGAGFGPETVARLLSGESAAGRADLAVVQRDLPPRLVRRIGRLPRMALALGQRAAGEANGRIQHVAFGTGFGPQSETYSFLAELARSEARLASPTAFIGSVHNAPAGQLAIHLDARGLNLTTTGDETAFEQALMSLGLLLPDDGTEALLLGADEFHDRLSPLLKPGLDADGGAAFRVTASTAGCGAALALHYLGRAGGPEVLLESLKGAKCGRERYGALLVGRADAPLAEALARALDLPVLAYRPWIGAFPTASACAVALAIELLQQGRLPTELTLAGEIRLRGLGILVLTSGAAQAALVGVLPGPGR